MVDLKYHTFRCSITIRADYNIFFDWRWLINSHCWRLKTRYLPYEVLYNDKAKVLHFKMKRAGWSSTSVPKINALQDDCIASDHLGRAKKLWAMQEYETKHTGLHWAHFLSHFLSFSVLPFSRWSLLTLRLPSISFLSAHCKCHALLSLSLSLWDLEALSVTWRGSSCVCLEAVVRLSRGNS